MNRRDLFKLFSAAGVTAAASAAPVRPTPVTSFVRMRARDVGSSRARVFLDNVDITSECLAVDTQRGEVEVFVRVKQPNGLFGVSHVAVKSGAVRVELDGFTYRSPRRG
jgi:hypothetical protein